MTLTVRDEWTVTNTSAAQSVTIVEPAGNSAPVPTFIPSCNGLTCSVSSAGTADPNTGDTIAYSWNWGDGTALSTGASPAAHVYAAAGNYTITLTTTDGWGKFASTTRNVTLTEPAGNPAPSVAVHRRAARRTRRARSTAPGPSIPRVTPIRYAWNFGDDRDTSTSANPSRTYAAPGTYTVTLTVTDVWGKATTVDPRRDHRPSRPATPGPTATFVATCTMLTCVMNSTGTVDPEGTRSRATRGTGVTARR